MNRLANFHAMKVHALNGNLYKKLSREERNLCIGFIRTNMELDKDAFAEKANRWMLDQEKPKNYSAMWALIIQSNTEKK